MKLNAGQLLWQAQQAQGTGLCIGADIHYAPDGPLDEKFYGNFVDEGHRLFGGQVEQILGALRTTFPPNLTLYNEHKIRPFITGVAGYFGGIMDAAWEEGIRVFKPQAAFYERLHPFGMLVLQSLITRIRERANNVEQTCFLILDAKRGDIADTQQPYFETYLSELTDEVFPGMPGSFGFDAITVTTWMGQDVLSPGLKFFKNGHGAIVVTRSSNPSGTTLQDLLVSPNAYVRLSEKQGPFTVTQLTLNNIAGIIGRKDVSAHEVMLYLTEQFCEVNGLNGDDGVSPIFSVMGSTVEMDESFRAIRPGGIGLIPGFGAQGGGLEKILALAVRDGPLKGHIGILSSSRAHDYPWIEKYGGSGDPLNWRNDIKRAIDSFRTDEREFYAQNDIPCVF